MGIRAVLFDYGGTILDPASEEEAHRECLARLVASHGVPLDPEELQRRTERMLAAEAPLQAQAWTPLRVLIPRALATVLEEFSVRLSDAEWRGFWQEYLAVHGEHARPFPEARAALDLVAAAGVAVGLVSDVDRDYLAATLAGTGLERRFDPVITSEEVGAGKPSPRIFQAALKALGIPAGEVAFVGDSLERDVRGAERAGMVAIHLDRSGATRHARTARDLVAAARLALASSGY